MLRVLYHERMTRGKFFIKDLNNRKLRVICGEVEYNALYFTAAHLVIGFDVPNAVLANSEYELYLYKIEA